ncbi:glycosyltransferase [Candidatus Protochlamydia phocaeensis]|uniref:glycosyltransferase n=1 Tax=Candidatus Protochlamydia phocaeensis TaxID=1414722 RepID=UPI0009ACA4AA|nr:glycosyltransferase [Candidatus Protochlamydia phocaeensis]
MPALPITDWNNTAIYFSGFLFGGSALLLLALYLFRWKSDWTSLVVWLVANLGSAWLAAILSNSPKAAIIALGINAFLVALLYRLIPVISLFGVFFLVSLLDPLLFGLVWLFNLAWSLKAYLNGPLFFAVASAAVLFGTLILCNALMGSWISLIRFSQLYFRFPRQKAARKAIEEAYFSKPWVSIHVPCYAEPPDIVIETLDALAALQYPHFEVLVVDNNTKDPALWRPLENHCMKLGSRFRFFHMDPLKGAKAGALNAALRLTAPQVEIIAVIDADFVVQPDFLEKLVGFFQDPKTGFVQSCHDYREWEGSRYLSACYFEYEKHFKLELPAASEWDIAYTVGTMCLFRRKALEEVGGWAEWCLTEDSEVSIRLHNHGYTGYYLKDTLGRGLIPETFEAYKKQRFRWIAGPVQQFQKHWRLYLPWSPSSQLTLPQKLGELFHSLSPLFNDALNLLMNVPILLVSLWFAIEKRQVFFVPPSLLVLFAIAIMRNVLCNWIQIRLMGGNWRNCIYEVLAERSLNYTRYKSFYMAWMNAKLEWKRTDKFKASSNIWRAFSSARSELIAAFIYMILAALLIPVAHFAPPDVICLGLLSIVNQTITFLCTPLMAFLSEYHLNEQNRTPVKESLALNPVQPGVLVNLKTEQEEEAPLN